MVNCCTGCMNNTKRNTNVSFFTYPKDRERRNAWLKAVDREDLITKLDDERKRPSYRICEEHFETTCFTFSKNGNVKYLSAEAFPTLNLPMNVGANTSHCPNEPGDQNQNIQNISVDNVPLCSYTDAPDNKIPILSDFTSRCVQADISNTEIINRGCGSRQSQTALHLSADTPKRKLLHQLQESKNTKPDLNRITKEDYLKLSEKFMTKSMSQLIKWQINLNAGSSGNRHNIDAEKEEGVQHTAILCKNCQNIIVGFRYKCITCEDYYLCKNCEMMEMHSEHYVLRIPKPLKCKEAAKIAQKLQKIFIPDEDIPPIKVKEEDPIGVSIGECGDDELIQDDNVDDDIHSSEQFKNITYSEVSDVIDKSKDLGEPTGTVRRKKRRTAERETVRDGKRMRDADAKMNPAPEIAFADSNSDSYIEVEIKQETNEESEMISRLEVGETVNPYVKENQL